MPGGAVFPQIQSLPRSERAATAAHRYAEARLGEYGAHVCGHIVWAFIVMGEHGITVRNQIGHEGFEISTYLRIGVFT